MIELIYMLLTIFAAFLAGLRLFLGLVKDAEDENHKARYWEYKYYCMEDDHYRIAKKEWRCLNRKYDCVYKSLFAEFEKHKKEYNEHKEMSE